MNTLFNPLPQARLSDLLRILACGNGLNDNQ